MTGKRGTTVLYVRVDEGLDAWLRGMAKASNLPLGRVVSALLKQARADGFDVGAVQVARGSPQERQ